MNQTLVQTIWGNADCLLTIFIGSSAEFALHPTVDWLFYTNKLPSDPLGRFASTVAYSHKLVFAPDQATQTQLAEQIQHIHARLEQQRGVAMPSVAYRDVLLMTTDYALRSYPLVFGRELSSTEKDSFIAETVKPWLTVLPVALPADYAAFCAMREETFGRLAHTAWSDRLLQSFRRATGPVGYALLQASFRWVVDARIIQMLGLQGGRFDWVFRGWIMFLRRTGLNRPLLRLALPRELFATLHQYA